MEEQYFTVKEFADKFGVSRQTAYKWIKKGYIKPVEKKMGGFSILLIPKKAMEMFVPGRYDVALIDLGMPGIPGDRVFREMLQADPSLISVLITGWELLNGDSRLSLFDFRIQKPFDDLDKVQDIVAQAVELHEERSGGA